MDSSPQHLNAGLFRWEVENPSPNRLDRWLEQLEALRQFHAQRLRSAVAAYVSASREIAHKVDLPTLPERLVPPRVLAVWEEAQPVLLSHSRKLLPFLPLFEAPEGPPEPDPVEEILGDFDGLTREQQEKVAENVALLWDYFQETFGGISGFLASPQTEQAAYMEKLNAASERMQVARGTNVAFHYVTVELVRQYLSFLQRGTADMSAVLLAERVVALIERGRQLTTIVLALPSNNHNRRRPRTQIA